MPENREQLQVFRKKAEALIKRTNADKAYQYAGMEMEELLHELQVFQIELEMQNEELRLSHEYLELERTNFARLYDLAPVGYLLLNKFGAVTEINATALNMLEVERVNVVGRRFQDYVVKEQSGDFYNIIRKMRVINTRHSCQLSIISHKGKVYYVQLEGIGIINPITADLQLYVAVIDITRKREAEQRLIESNERLKMTLEASATGTWEIDLKKQQIILDQNTYAILGLENWEFDGRYETFFKRLHPDDRESFKSQLSQVIAEERDLDVELRVLLNAPGLCFVAIRGHLVHQEPDIVRFMGIIIDVTEKRKLQREAEEALVNYQKSIVTAGLHAQEKERKRISYALHDGVAQTLYAIRLNLQYTCAGLLNDPANNLNQLLSQAISEIRNISFELMPSILNDFGLVESVKEMAKRLQAANFSVLVKAQGANERFNPDLEVSAFRIIQELVNNSIKHGNATETTIKINLMYQNLNIIVADNGNGFNLKASDYLTRGSGLLSIKNRVGLYNGNFEIKSDTGKGTMVNITLNAV